jgi:hypothetical protein
MTMQLRSWSATLAGMIGLAAVVVAVFWVADGPLSAAIVGGWLALFIAALHFGRGRSQTITVMSGAGDERIRSLSTRALSFAGGVMAFVLPGWWLASVLTENENYAVAALTAIFAVSFIGASFWLARRG